MVTSGRPTGHRRPVLVGIVAFLSGCLGGSSGSEDDATEDESETDDGGSNTANQYGLRGEFVDEEQVPEGYDVLPSDDDRIAGRGLYPTLFEEVEAIPEEERGDEYVSGGTASGESDVGSETLGAATDARDATTTGTGRGTAPGSRFRKPHYVEHDGAVLRVTIADLGQDTGA